MVCQYVRVVCADLPLFVSVLQAQSIHGTHYCGQGLDGVAVNDRLVLLYVISGETVLMDDPGHKETHHFSQWKEQIYISTPKSENKTSWMKQSDTDRLNASYTLY